MYPVPWRARGDPAPQSGIRVTRVLIVDDKEENLFYLRALLTNGGCTVQVARNGVEALFRAQEQLPEVVISDLLMPLRDGYTLLRRWKADDRLRQVPFIVYTANSTNPKDEALARQYGADVFVLKPNAPDEFLARLREVCANAPATVPRRASTPPAPAGALFDGFEESLVRTGEFSAARRPSSVAPDAGVAGRRADEAALRASDADFRSLAEAMPQIVWIARADGWNTYLNQQWVDYTGLTIEESAGHEWTTPFYPEDQERARSAWERAAVAGGTYSVECRMRRKDGVYRWWLIRGVPVKHDDGSIAKWIGTCTDIQDLKVAELEIVRVNRALTMRSSCSEALLHAQDEHSLLEQICRIAVEQAGYRMAWVGYAQDDGPRSITPIAHAGVEDGYLSEIKVSWDENRLNGQGPGGRVIRTGEPVIADDLSLDPTYAHLTEAARRRRYRGATVLPLSDGARTFGLLSLHSAEASTTTPDELTLLRDMARNLAFGIVNLRARAEQQRLQTAVFKVAAGVSAASGAAFFEQLTRNMAEALGADAGFIATLLPGEPCMAETVAAVIDGAAHENFEFVVAGTPCDPLFAADLSVITEHIADDFPHFPSFLALGAQGFVGKRLDSSTGEPLGFLFVVFRFKPTHVELITSTLQIFAARAAAELERQRTDAQISEQAALLDTAHEAILVMDLSDTIIYWNRGAERTYGWTAAEALGKNADELYRKDPAPYAEGRATLLATDAWTAELTQRTKDGRDITVSVHWTLVRDAEGRPKSILAINTDVTETRKMELQFFRAQRMESIGTLASGIAHDLNNVLAPILLAVETLKEVVTDEEDIGLLNTLQTSAQRGAELVRQVLTFARGVEGKRMTVNLLPVLSELVQVAKDTFPKSIDVRFVAGREPWTVTGDPTQMHQVFLNLFVNARDAMADGGTLTTRMENVTIDDTYAAMNPGSIPGAHLKVTVKDTGTGIPQDIRDRIFEPFFTTKKIGDGTGLGLSTTMAIIKSHGGFIHVYSELGKGTEFRVYLPANAVNVVAEEVTMEQTRLPAGQNELILVVDDEAAIRRVAQRTLERFGYRVLLAANGAEAVAIYAQRGNEIAAVLTDMAMPVMDGLATILALRALDPGVTVIASSGLSSRGSVAGALGAGFEFFVPKPYTADAMLTVLHRALHPTTPR